MSSLYKRVKNQKGIALASVLIMITLLSLLAATILRLAYLSYERKVTEKRNTENFYCAEAVIDTIKTVVQNSIAVAIPSAEYSEADFVQAAYTAITGNTNAVSVGQEYDGAAVEQYLFKRAVFSNVNTREERYDTNYYAKDASGNPLSTSVYNAITSVDGAFNPDGMDNPSANGGSFSIDKIVIEKDGIRIKDVDIKYVNDMGYVATIHTDIMIRAPKYITVTDAPLGSYSMFAGCGAAVYSCADSGDSQYRALSGDLLYMHQEGNGYFGSMLEEKNDHTSMIIGATPDADKAGGRGRTMLSFDGTNIVFNGDVRVKNGGALIFTGGDGTETAMVQVNGFIVLEDGASLFIAPNVKINCRGIVTSVTYWDDDDTNPDHAFPNDVKTYTAYTGVDALATANQFYPLTSDFVVNSLGESNQSLNNYYASKIDLEQLFYETGLISGTYTIDNEDCDDRYEEVASGSKSAAGVYMLNSKQNKSGWDSKIGCYYNKLSCSVVAGEWNWTLLTKANTNIYCNVADTNLKRDNKVYYNGNYYDKYFFDIVNVPVIENAVSEKTAVNYALTNYNICDETKYTKTSWSQLKTDSNYTGLTKYYWDGTKNQNVMLTWQDGLYSWDELKALGYLTRPFYKPKDMGYDKFSYGSSFTTTVGSFSLPSNGDSFSFFPADNFSVSSGSLQFFVTANKDITVRVSSGYSSGVLLSAKRIEYSQSKGIMRVISLLELSKKCGTGTIETEGNPVHELLEKMGSGILNRNASQFNFENNKELILVDNMFNEGISAFWKMNSSEQGGAADNSNKDLVDVDNWNKN